MLPLSALWWMRLSKRLVHASWWKGLAHWWVELGLILLVGRTVLRKMLSSLSADGWGCLLALLVVWPEVSQHWSLQAFGWVGLGEEVAASRRGHSNEYSPELPLPVYLSPQ